MVNNAIPAAGAALLAFGLVCLATLPFTSPTWMDVAMSGIVLGLMAVGIVAAAFVAYPMAKADADCKRKACSEDDK